MVFKNGVKSIQATGYNAAQTVQDQCWIRLVPANLTKLPNFQANLTGLTQLLGWVRTQGPKTKSNQVRLTSKRFQIQVQPNNVHRT